MKFLSTPSARRATPWYYGYVYGTQYFYPRPPRGGRQSSPNISTIRSIFLSTPSARRATLGSAASPPEIVISIHALREEGDGDGLLDVLGLSISIHALREEGDVFYSVGHLAAHLFLSTPSARRATQLFRHEVLRVNAFLSTPSARRATANLGEQAILKKISIHALREEGDS